MATLPPNSLQIVSLTPPTATRNTLHASILPSTPTTLPPSSSLSFEFKNGDQEVFVERVTHRELMVQDDGSLIATVPDVPIFKADEEGNQRETEVVMFVWKGEKLLGSWGVGRY